MQTTFTKKVPKRKNTALQYICR